MRIIFGILAAGFTFALLCFVMALLMVVTNTPSTSGLYAIPMGVISLGAAAFTWSRIP